MNSLKKNFLFNAAYQVLGLIVPLLVAPYVSRVLGPEGIGTYSYTYSIVYYFMIVALLGMNNYGNRSVAKVRDDKEKLSRTFWEIYTLQLIVTIIIFIVYIGFIFFNTEYKVIYIILSLYVISVAFDINWLYCGLEEFKFTVIRSAIVRVMSAVAIFLFVKERGDLWIYTLILSSITLINQIVLWPTLFKHVKFYRVRLKDVLKHLKPTALLFIPILSFSIYNVMDKIMIGSLSSKIQVGYYENAEKIVNIPLYAVAALGTATLPRIANLNSNKNENLDTIKTIIEKSITYVLFFLIPIVFGMIAVADYIVPLYLGEEFIYSVLPLKLLSIMLIFKACSQIIRNQYLLPMEKDNVYIRATLMGAIINLILNWILIPKFEAVGACIATVITEIVISIYQMINMEKDLKIIKNVRGNISTIFIKSAVMFMGVMMLGTIIKNEPIKNILQITSGCLIYILLNGNFIKDNILPMIKKKKRTNESAKALEK